MKCSITIMAFAIGCSISSAGAIELSNPFMTTAPTRVMVHEIVEQPVTTVHRSRHFSRHHHRRHPSSRKSVTSSPSKAIAPTPRARPFDLGKMTWRERWQGLADHAAFFDLNPLSPQEWVMTPSALDTVAIKTVKPKYQDQISVYTESSSNVRPIPLAPAFPPKTDMRNMIAVVLGSACIAFGLFRTPKFLERKVFA